MKIKIANPKKEEMDRFLHGIIGVVEATNFESYCLWKIHHEEHGDPWKSGGGGPMVQVGEIGDLPVCIALIVNEVKGHRILFVEATSRAVDHDMIRDWLQKNVPVTAFEDNDPRKRLNITDANNFGNVFPREPVAAAA